MGRFRYKGLAAAGLMAATLSWSAEAASKDHVVVIENMAFGDVPADVHVGDAIVWVNKDIFRHSATARDSSFDVDLPPASEGRAVLMRAGTIEYSCKFHPGMVARIVATD